MPRQCANCGSTIPEGSIAWGPAHQPVCSPCNRKKLGLPPLNGKAESDFRERVTLDDHVESDAEKPLKERELRG